MKILISSHAFAPSIGGIETVSALLGREFVRRGHNVQLITQTPEDSPEQFSFPVIRCPSLGRLWRALQWCDLFWQNNLSLRTLWPASSLGVPTVITHQGSYCRRPAGLDLLQRLKHAVVRRNCSIAISRAVGNCFPTNSTVIPNPFDAELFESGASADERPNELLFVGRLVAEKGLDLLLFALDELRPEQLSPRLTIVGGGPELARMTALSEKLLLRDQIIFKGPLRGEKLAEILCAHKILVVPSRYDEPFGVVALEGIASGCVVVGSSGGGLPEAIGPCGTTFPNGDVSALAREIARLLTQPNECAKLREAAPQHLARFHPARVADEYLRIFEEEAR